MNRKSIMITLLALLLVIPVMGQAAPVGKFTSIEGNVDITSPGGDAVPAKPGDEVNAGDTIRAKNRAKCEVAFLDGSIIRIAENSRVRVAEFSGREKKGQYKVVLDLSRGKIQSIVNPVTGASSSGSIFGFYGNEIREMVSAAMGVGGTVNYEVRTPTAVYRARGTEFFTYYQSGISGSLVTKGRVEGFSLHRPHEVHQISDGQSLTVADPQAAPQIRTATAMERQQHEKDTARSERPREATVAASLPSPVAELAQVAAFDQISIVDQIGGSIEPPPPALPVSPPPPAQPIVPPTAADTTPPVITLEGLPAAITNTPSAAITVTASEQVTYTYTLDGVAVASPNLANLTEGSHTFIVTATDVAGNKSSQSHIWKTDYTPPAITLTGTPPAATNVSTATIGVVSSETATFTYTLDGAAVTSPNLANLTEGNHTFTVTATDQAHNSSTQTHTWKTDYTPPGIALTPHASGRQDGRADVTVDLTGNEAVVFTSRLDGGPSITGAVLDLAGLEPGDHTLTIEATDDAGNKNIHTLTFNLENYGLSGLIAGAVDGVLAGDVAGVDGRDWGGWQVAMSGSAAALPGANWQARAGGQLAGTEHSGYWLADLGGEAWTGGQVKGAISYRYLTARALGYFDSPLAGTYQFNPDTSLYDWQGTTGGVFTETPLAFGGSIDGGYHGYENNMVNYYSVISGFLGTTESPFTSATELNVAGAPVDLYMMGEAWPEGRSAWWGSLRETSGAKGAIIPEGFIAGQTSTDQESMSGSLTSLYIDKAGNAGILEGSFDGFYYPLQAGSGMFEATSGWLQATKKATGYTAYDPAVNLGLSYLDGAFAGSFFDALNQPAGSIGAGGSIAGVSWGKTGSYAAWLQKSAANPEPWGIFNLELGGHYTGTPTDNFSLQVAGASPWRGGTGPGYWLAEVYGTQWSDPSGGLSQQITGDLQGTYLTDRVLGTMSGTLLGSSDPDILKPDVWAASAQGTFEEQPLALGAELNAYYHYYDGVAGDVTSDYGYLTGLFGTVASPSASTTLNEPGPLAEFTLLGQAAPYGQTTWWGDLTAPYVADGGALPLGLVGGRTTAHYDYASGLYLQGQEAQEGLLAGLYVDKDGNAGTLDGSFTGTFYPMSDGFGDNNAGPFIANGFLQATPKASGFDPATASYNYSPIDGTYAGSLTDGAGSAIGTVTAAAAGDLQDTSWGYLGSYSYWLEKADVPEPWGIFNMELGGNYTAGAAPQNWALRLGGRSFRGLDANEYWIAETADGIWVETDGDKRIAAGLMGRYMTPITLGQLNGGVLGSYDTNNTPGAWEAIALGTFENTQPLLFSAEIDAGYHQLENNLVTPLNTFSGYLGTTASPFASATAIGVPGAPVDLSMMGEAWPEGRTSWWGSLYDVNGGNGAIIPDGFIAGTTAVSDAAQETMTGSLTSLYIDPAGNAGILEGGFDGFYYPLRGDMGLFEATSGWLRATQKATGYAAYDPAVNLGLNYLDGAFSGSFFDGSNQPAGGIAAGGSIADVSWGKTGSYAAWLQKSAANPEPWGIFNLELGGHYTGTPTDNFSLQVAGLSPWRGGTGPGYWLAEVYGTQWSDPSGAGLSQQIAGDLQGAYLTDRVLGTMAGTLLGSSDPDITNPDAWAASANGTFDEQPLALGGEMTATYHAYDNAAGEIVGSSGYLTGLFGTVEDMLTPGAELHLLGEAAPYGQTTWWGELFNIYQPEGGVLPVGLIGGRTTAHYDYAAGQYLGNPEFQEGTFLSLYVDKDGNAGTLESNFTGAFYPMADSLGDSNAGPFIANGVLQATPKASGFDPAAATYNYSPIDGAYAGALADGAGSNTGSITAAAAGGLQDTSWGYLGSYSYWLEKEDVPEPWGIFNMELGGDYQLAEGATTPQNWALRLGGTSFRGLEANEYWIAETTDGTWTETAGDKRIAAGLTGRYLTPTTLGQLNGGVLGSYDTNNTPGNWEAIALGTFAASPLAFSAELFAAYHQNEGNVVNSFNNFSGLLGTTASPFASATELNVPGIPVDLYMMGEALPAGKTAWWGSLYDVNGGNGALLPDGFIAGRMTADSGTEERLTGSLASLYIDPAGNAGILGGSFDGLYYPLRSDMGLFEATSGSLWATKKTTGYASYDPAVNLGVNYLNGAFAGSFLDGLNQSTGAIVADGSIADVSWGNLGSYTAWLQQSPATPEPWGIFNIELGGHYTGVPTNNFALQLGGTSWRALDSREYWLTETSGTVWPDSEEEGSSQQIMGSLQGSYLTTQTLGTMTGTMLGSADADTLNPNAWQAVIIGTFEEQPLAFVSDLASDDGAVFALMGGRSSLWTNTDTPALMMGDWGGTSGVWAMPVWSDNFQDGSVTTYDGGAYQGFSSLVVDDGQGVDVGLSGLYIDPAGQTGYLQGELPGIAYPDLGLFSAQGDLARTEMAPAPAGMTADIFSVMESGLQSLTLAGPPVAVGFTSEMRNEAWIDGLTSWGIWQSLLEGTGASAAPVTWQWETALGTDAAYWTNYADATWLSDTSKITGTVSGAKADWVNASTSVFGGAIKGLFDPATASWKAVSQGAWIETGKFLEMTATNPAALQAMNIPAIQVGSATLAQGAGTVNNLSNVTMDNVRFFATSTGSVPKIWATNAVSGNFSAAPSVTGPAVPLAGGGLNANFGINNWGNGTWGAKVTGGTGTLSGGSYNGPVNFQGGAAGQIGAGSFTGTGAGVVK